MITSPNPHIPCDTLLISLYKLSPYLEAGLLPKLAAVIRHLAIKWGIGLGLGEFARPPVGIYLHFWAISKRAPEITGLPRKKTG
jgi:hypothetical protein